MKNQALFLLLFLLLYFSCQSPDASKSPTANDDLLRWEFPLPRTHTGVLLGNGTQGLMVWGGDNQLNITVGRAGFWDHRGGNDFSARTNYQMVKNLLQRGDEAGLRRAFDISENRGGVAYRPHQVGGGRVEVRLPEDWKITHADLHFREGYMTIYADSPSGRSVRFPLRQAVYQEIATLELPADLADEASFAIVPSWAHTQEELTRIGVSAPEVWTPEEDSEKAGAFMQPLPEDDPLGVAYRLRDGRLVIGSHLGPGALEKAVQLTEEVDLDQARQETETFWADYWREVPEVSLPDPEIQELYDYGLYKQACVTPPHGVAAGLQGPFLEEYQLPPWSADYHFNVNIQMIYWPTLATNRTEHLMPIWELMLDWMPKMRETGEKFFGREGAIMMPHAIDDRLQVVGSFWTGTIDHACAAWMAQLAWLHYRYTLDEEVLQEVAWPLLNGAFEGFWAMTEEISDGDGGTRFTLPISVSPEFKGSRMDAWGADASFQLAAYQMVAELLQKASSVLETPADPRWQEVRDKLPPYTIFEGPRTLEHPENETQRIALWEGMDLIQSHRHHSHLAAIYPFATVDPADPAHQQIVDNSLWHLTYQGAGGWSGWCVPWAATLFARNDDADAAVAWLHYFKDHYTNEGRGTLHNAWHRGMSYIADRPWAKATDRPNREIMQLDGGFGALTAVIELLVQNRRDGIHVLPDIPVGWSSFSFDRIRTEGAFQVGATVENGQTTEVRVTALADGPLKLWHGLGEEYELDGQPQTGEVLEVECRAGQQWTLRKAK